MLHPVLQAFHDAYGDRFPDLKISVNEDHLVCKYTDADGLTYRSEGVMLGDDVNPFFYCDDDGGGVSEPDPLAALARACALMADDGEDEMVNAPAKPDTFGAIVWTRAISGRLAEMERITNDLLDERLRLNPPTIADLPLFNPGVIMSDPTKPPPRPPGPWDHEDPPDGARPKSPRRPKPPPPQDDDSNGVTLGWLDEPAAPGDYAEIVRRAANAPSTAVHTMTVEACGDWSSLLGVAHDGDLIPPEHDDAAPCPTCISTPCGCEEE